MSEALHMASDGTYGVLLHNKNECTVPEIKQLVSRFGKAVRVSAIPGKLQVFVYFKEYAEAKSCLDTLKDDPMFFALPARPRENRVPNQNGYFRYKSLPRRVEDRESSLVRPTLRSKSTVQKRDESSTDSGGPIKNVRFSRSSKPKSLTRRKERKEKSCMDADQLLKEYQSGERPPPLLNIVDEHAEYVIEECGLASSIEVFLYNLNTCITEGHISALCSKFVSPLSVRLQFYEFNDVPFNVAFVELRSHDDAKALKEGIHNRTLKGKQLYVGFVSEFV